MNENSTCTATARVTDHICAAHTHTHTPAVPRLWKQRGPHEETAKALQGAHPKLGEPKLGDVWCDDDGIVHNYLLANRNVAVFDDAAVMILTIMT